MQAAACRDSGKALRPDGASRVRQLFAEPAKIRIRCRSGRYCGREPAGSASPTACRPARSRTRCAVDSATRPDHRCLRSGRDGSCQCQPDCREPDQGTTTPHRSTTPGVHHGVEHVKVLSRRQSGRMCFVGWIVAVSARPPGTAALACACDDSNRTAGNSVATAASPASERSSSGHYRATGAPAWIAKACCIGLRRRDGSS